MISDDPAVIEPTLKALRIGYDSGKTRSIEYRKQALRNMVTGLIQLAPKFIEAYKEDLKYKEPYLVRSAHIGSVINDIDYILQHIDEWVKPRVADCNLFIGGGEAYILPEPYGVCLVLGAWNFPLPLCLKPAAAAICAGNCVCVKPSEITPNISNVIKELFDTFMDKDCYRALEGGIRLSSEVCTYPWDLIFFTGGSEIGKKVAHAAANNLVPCILELGGKSPAIVDSDADITSAATRIASTKMSNLGQLCVAPDYVFVHVSKRDELIRCIVEKWREFYGEDPQKSKDLPRIVNAFHTERVAQMLLEDHGGRVVVGGTIDRSDRYIAPTLVDNPRLDSKMMTEEIFGPILPVIVFQKLNEVVDYLNKRPKPLALYYFGQKKDQQDYICMQTSSGGVLINDCFLHLLNDEIPFGGVGNSGYGSYHGLFGFNNCSHLKPIMKKNNYNGFPYNNRFPPITQDKMKKMKLLNQYGTKIMVGKMIRNIKIAIFFIIMVILLRMFTGKDESQSDL